MEENGNEGSRESETRVQGLTRLTSWASLTAHFRWIMSVGVLIVSSSSVFIFQNCAGPEAPTEKDDETLPIVSGLAEKAPFAYDGFFDTLGYMSCSDLTSKTFNPSTYFTFRAGSYRAGGLKLKDNYFARFAEEIETKEEKLELLTTSPANTRTQAQLSIRNLANFQNVFTQNGTPVDGEDFQNLLPGLGTEEMTEYVLSLPTGQRIRYMRNGLVTGTRFEASLNFGDSYSLAEGVRNYLSSEAVLSLTFMDLKSASRVVAKGPADIDPNAPDQRRSVYGKGLIVRFRQPTPSSGALYGQFPAHTLREVSELSLEDRTDSSQIKAWTCPTSLQFRIVRPQDLVNADAHCTTPVDPAVVDPTLRMVRRILRVEDWYVDMTNRCIVNKKFQGTGCYGSDDYIVQYDTSKPCTNGNSKEQCVHYASICYRQD